MVVSIDGTEPATLSPPKVNLTVENETSDVYSHIGTGDLSRMFPIETVEGLMHTRWLKHNG